MVERRDESLLAKDPPVNHLMILRDAAWSNTFA